MESVQQEADVITTQSLESTRRMIGYTSESHDVARRTQETLMAQGQQMERIQKTLNRIDAANANASHSLHKMNSCCSCCMCNHHHRHHPRKNRDQHVVSASAITQQPRQELQHREVTSGGLFYHPHFENDPREKEINDNLGKVDSMIFILKDQALSIEQELDRQDPLLSSIVDHVSATKDKTHRNLTKASRFL
jgi:hypothetical protein